MKNKSTNGNALEPESIVAPIIKPLYRSDRGVLYHGDCLTILPFIKTESIDTVFADPPFNLNKKYGANVNDNMPGIEYVDWCKKWSSECVRVLKPGGALLIYNLPKW